jgi:hypothetical protein
MDAPLGGLLKLETRFLNSLSFLCCLLFELSSVPSSGSGAAVDHTPEVSRTKEGKIQSP